MITLRESAVLDEALGHVGSDEADVAVPTAPSAGGFTVTPVAEEATVPVAPAGRLPTEQPTVRIEDLDGAPLVDAAPDNGLSVLLDRSLARAGVHPETVMRTSAAAAAPQLAAAGLGVAVCPVSAVSHGFPGAARSFSPQWVRHLMAVDARGTGSARRTVHPRPAREERKAAISLEIAREAVDLFVAQGVAATTGEQIGRAVGVSARTAWRYFPTKESCVRPLLATGVETIAEALRRWDRGRPLPDAFEYLWATGAVLPGRDVGALLRLARTEVGPRAVWLQPHDEAEPVFARALAERAGLPADDVRPAVRAAMLNAALRAAVEHHAFHAAGPAADPGSARADLAATVRTAPALTAAGIV